MHSRCTPYGLFAGCGIVKGFNDCYEVFGRGYINTRLDMNFTCALAQELTKLPFLLPYLKFYPNNSIYNLQDKIRFVEYYYKEKRRIHQISEVDNSAYLQAILEKAQHGATLNELAESIIDEEITSDDAIGFLQEIIVAQLLVSELEPSVTGEELLTQILNVISSLERRLRGLIAEEETTQFQHIINLLQNTQTHLNKIDEQIGNPISLYEDLTINLKQLNIPFEWSKLFQTIFFTDSPIYYK